MTILHLSDTHGLHRQMEHLPLADVVVHSGDFCEEGTIEEVEDFVEWFAADEVSGAYDTAIYVEKRADFA